MRRPIPIISVGLLLVAACGSETPGFSFGGDVGEEVYRFLGDGRRTVPGDWCPGPGGCLGDPCADGEDCGSGWCVLHRGDSVCTDACGACPPGWTCRTVGAGTPNAVELCLSDHPSLCLPCVAPSDCLSAGGLQDRCVLLGNEGSFCGGDCDAGCPPGTSCQTVTTVDGIEAAQCLPEDGVCACSQHAVAGGLWTLCKVTNGWGACPGKRSCTEAGLTSCEGPVPSKEVCDGDDDDCDGAVDEDSCEDHNQCTEDSCQGPAGCQHLPLDGALCGGVCIAGGLCEVGECVGQSVMNCDDGNPCTEDYCDPDEGCGSEPHEDACDDGDPCTAADHCEGGVCVGILQDPCDPETDPCVDGECIAGAIEDASEPCGSCGARLRSRTCSGACSWGPWGDWGPCTGEGPCEPGDTGQEEASCGDCGGKTRTRTCNDLCQWDDFGSWSACSGEGACTPGETQSEQSGCGDCGSKTRSRSCSDACQWEAWGGWSACAGQGACSPGQTQDGGCDPCLEKTCNGSCQWGGCQFKPGANCEWQNGTHWKCCGPGKWHFCLPPVYGCVWSSDCVTCTGCGC